MKFEEMQVVANNVRITQEEDILFIAVDLSRTLGLSKSGKMMGIGNTGGFQAIPVDNPRRKVTKLNLYLGEVG